MRVLYIQTYTNTRGINKGYTGIAFHTYMYVRIYKENKSKAKEKAIQQPVTRLTNFYFNNKKKTILYNNNTILIKKKRKCFFDF